VKKLAQRSNEPSSADAGPCSVTAVSFRPSHTTNAMGTRFVLDRHDTSCCCEQSHDKPHNWHADSSRRSIVHLSGERTAPGDLEPKLSQMSHSFWLHSEAHNFFICNQLKMPAAFSTVHSGESILTISCSNDTCITPSSVAFSRGDPTLGTPSTKPQNVHAIFETGPLK